jgi:hypothetical protein
MKTFHFSIAGTREQARSSVVEQADSQIMAGQCTPEVKVAVLAICDALPGREQTGSIDGHFDDPAGLVEGQIPRFNITCVVTGL